MIADRGQKPVAKGHFSKTPFAHILIYLYEHQMSGTLTVSDYANDVSIFFLEGLPAKVKSTIPGKDLGRILCDLGLITEKQLEKCKETMSHGKGLQGEILMRQNAIDTKGLVRGLKEQILMKLADVFGMTDATYSFFDKANFLVDYGASELFPIDPFPLLISGMRSKGGNLNLDPILDPLNGKWISLREIEPLRRFKLNEDERKLCVELLNTPLKYEDLLVSGRYPEQMVRYAVYVFFICKQLSISDSEPAQTPSTALRAQIEQLTSTAPPSEKISDDPKISALKEEVKITAGRISTHNYYEMLGLPFGAPPDEVRKAFFKLAKKYHPDRVAGTAAADMKDTLQYVFSNLSQAHSTLIDPDTRDEYEASVREGQKRTSLAPRPSNEAEVRDALEAENLHQKTLVFMKRGQYKEAMELIERVRLLNPKEGEYIATWAFLQGHARQRGLPLDDLIERLRQALTLNPNSERIMLYLAKMLERVGHDTESRVFYKRVLKLNPSNIEAGRAVRLMEMRDRKEQEKGKSKGFLKKIFGEKP